MRYLSFDIECYDGTHICEFGYVLIDENFSVLDRKCITINPEVDLNPSVRGRARNVQLAFSAETYRDSPTFDNYYDQIKKLLSMPDCQILGFALANDVSFLKTACQRYHKEQFGFLYHDFQKYYQAYTKAPNKTSIQNVVKELQIPNITLHKSEDDAWVVIRALQIISEREHLTLADTLEYLQKRSKQFRGEMRKNREEALLKGIDSGNIKAQNLFLKNFIRGLEKVKQTKKNIFSGKSVCVSSVFLTRHFNAFLAVVTALYKCGATYTGKASVCDIFICYAEGEEDARYASAKQIKEEGKAITILTLDNCLKILHITQTELNKVDHAREYFRSRQEKKKRAQEHMQMLHANATIGDILKAKGITVTSE